jgi:hypothetical protein
VIPLPTAETRMQASISSTTSSGKSIVSGAASKAKRSDSGSMKVSLAIVSRRTASTPPRKPTITPSITNGQRMNQLVAPTSFITSTSRRRAKIDSRMVLAIRAIEANRRRAARPAVRIFTSPVAERILSVSSSRFFTSSIAGSADVPPGSSRLTMASIRSGSSGVTRNESGSGLLPSSSAPSSKAFGFFSLARASASSLEMKSTDFTFGVLWSASRSSARSASVASGFR